MSSKGGIAAFYPLADRLPPVLGKLLNPTIVKSFLAIGGQGMVSCANFLTGVIIGKMCGKEELGLYSLGFTLVAFVSELQMSLIATPYMVYSPRLQGAEHARYTGSSLIHQLGFIVLTFILFSLGMAYLALWGNTPGLAPVIAAIAAMIGFVLMREFARRMCFSALRMKTAFILDWSVSLLQLGGLVLLYRLGALSARNAYLVIGVVGGAIALAWFMLNRNIFSFSASGAVEDLKRNWAFSKWVVASGLLWSLSMNFYPWLLTYFRGTAETGIFAACLGVANFGTMILMGAQNFLGPKIASVYAEAGFARMSWFVVRASAAFLIPMLPFCLLLWLFGDPLIALLYGSGFAGSGAIVSVLALNLLALALAFSFSRALFAIERADIDFAVNFCALFVLLTVGVWLVRAYGPMGAALGLLTANVVASTVRGAVFFRFVRSNTRRTET